MRDNLRKWRVTSWVLALLLMLPIIAITYTAVSATDEVFTHLLQTVMPIYASNTLWLVVATLLLSLLFGVPSAWLMAMCHLPTARVLQWAFVLPLAMPSYIIGYIYTDWFDFAGPVQIALRQWFDWHTPQDYWFPEVRSLGGASLVLALVLFPYVYLMTRAAFIEQGTSLLQSARLLRCSPWQSFYRVSLPLARPAIAVALSLIAMETVGDFGTVKYFAVNTLTTAVYDAWLGYSALTAAAKISALMLFLILILVGGERFSRRKQQLFQQQFEHADDARYVLRGWPKWLALVWCWGLIGAAFLLPVLQLLSYVWHYLDQSWRIEMQGYALNSLYVSALAALVAVTIALLINFNHRLRAQRSTSLPMRLASLGYALPGTVLAIGVMLPLTRLDYLLNDIAAVLDFGRPGLIFSGSVVAIVFAFVVRFAAVAIGSIESSLGKIPPSLDMAAKTMGQDATQMLKRVHLPLVRRGCLIAALLVFIESMKELNAALLLRPFNFETLATYVFNFASDEQLELAALPAILLVLVGLIPLILINRSLEHKY